MEKHPIPESLEDRFKLAKDILMPEIITNIDDEEWRNKNKESMEYYMADDSMVILMLKICQHKEWESDRIHLFMAVSEFMNSIQKDGPLHTMNKGRPPIFGQVDINKMIKEAYSGKTSDS